MPTTTDSIKKDLTLKAPRARVWRALTDPAEFGAWFGARLTGKFTPGARVKVAITIPGYEHVRMEITIERVEPERLFSFHWHPYAVDMQRDYSVEPPTRVEFTLEEAPGGTRLRVIESGFDELPPERRDEAFRMNDGGWNGQLANIERHVTQR